MFVLSHCPTDSLLIHRRIVWLFPPKCTSITGEVDPGDSTRTISRIPSCWKAIAWHLLLGFGLIYVDSNLNRRWIYPIFPLYAILDFVLADWEIKPFRGDFGIITFFISIGIYLISFIDVIIISTLHINKLITQSRKQMFDLSGRD